MFHFEPEDAVSKKLGKALLLAPQQHATAMTQAKMSAAKVEGFRKGGLVDHRMGQSTICRAEGECQ